MYIRVGKKNGIQKTEPNLIRKSNNKPQPKLAKYPDGFKILVYNRQGRP